MDELRIVLDGPPGETSGRFVEVEDAGGRSVDAGEWRERGDGLWELRLRDGKTADGGRAQAVFYECYAERMHRARRWADGDTDALDRADDDRVDRPDSWCLWTLRYAGTWNNPLFPAGYDDEALRRFRAAMVKVMALALTAVLWTDRRCSTVDTEQAATLEPAIIDRPGPTAGTE